MKRSSATQMQQKSTITDSFLIILTSAILVSLVVGSLVLSTFFNSLFWTVMCNGLLYLIMIFFEKKSFNFGYFVPQLGLTFTIFGVLSQTMSISLIRYILVGCAFIVIIIRLFDLVLNIYKNQDSFIGRYKAFRFNFPEYRRRLVKGFLYFIVYFVLIIAVAGASTFLIGLTLPEPVDFNGFEGVLSSVAGTTTPIEIQATGVHTNLESMSQPIDADLNEAIQDGEDDVQSGNKEGIALPVFSILILASLLTSFLGMIFSGAFAEVFLRPINPIKIAPFVIFAPNSILMRMWVCYPLGKYLHDARITVRPFYEESDHRSILLLNSQDSATFETCSISKSFSMIHGVWEIEIAKDEEDSESLYNLLMNVEKYKDRKSGIQLIVQGESDSGKYISIEHKFYICDMIKGYMYAAYHCPEKQGNSRSRFSNRLWFSNFFKVVSLESIEQFSEQCKDIKNVDLNSKRNTDQCCKLEKPAEDLEDIMMTLLNIDVEKRKENIEKYLELPLTDWDPHLSPEDRITITKL